VCVSDARARLVAEHESNAKSASDWNSPTSSFSRGCRCDDSDVRLSRPRATVMPGQWREANRLDDHPPARGRRLSHVRGLRIMCGARRRSTPRGGSMRPMKRAAVGITAAAILAIFFAPVSVADPTEQLRSQIDAARSEAGCPPFELDPILNDVSQRIVSEMADYVKHTARALPTGDAELLGVMRDSGYHTAKARLLSGYGDYRTGGAGDNEAKAIRGTVLQGLGFEALDDCLYTKYGLSAISDDSSEGWPSTAPRSYTVTVVVLAGA
jgi:hypothetical protein